MADVNAVGNCLDDFIEKVVIKLTVNTTGTLTKLTPIDTGFARSNWVPHIGSAFKGTAGNYEDGANLAEQHVGLLTVMGNYKLERGSVFIANNADYIQALEAGHSKQAPQGFVIRSIAAAVNSTIVRQ